MGKKIRRIKTVKGIRNYILGPLTTKLRRDVRDGRILNESDLGNCFVHHLKNGIDEKIFLISTNKTLSGITINGKSSKGKFLMPDIIVRDKDDEHKLRLVIELKADKRATSAYPGRAAESKINDDLKKLNKFTKNSFLKKQIKCLIFVYLYRDTEWSENKIKNKISKKLHHRRIKIIVINRYWNAKKGKLYSQPTMDRIDEEFLASHKIVVGGDKK